MSTATTGGIRCGWKVSLDAGATFVKCTERRTASMNMQRVGADACNADTSVDPSNPDISFAETKTVQLNPSGSIDMNYIEGDPVQQAIRAAALSGTPLYFLFFMIEEAGADAWKGQFNIEMGLNGNPTSVGMFQATLSCAGFLALIEQS